jgi:TRAP-type C4-dicarboxylate transport system permease small subunit
MAHESSSEPDTGPFGRAFLAEIGVIGVVGIALMIAILAVMGLGVFFRYVLNDSLSWSEELARYGLVYVTFLGCATAVRRRSHIRVNLLEEMLPAAWARGLRVLQELLTLGFVAYLTIKAFEILAILGHARSAAMQLPISYVYAAIVIGFGLAALRLGYDLLWKRDS